MKIAEKVKKSRPRRYGRENELGIDDICRIYKKEKTLALSIIDSYHDEKVYMWIKQGKVGKKMYYDYMYYVKNF